MKALRAWPIFIIALFGFSASPTRADYHYASHEGSNEYPYTSWETAAHLIQDASNAADPYDTVYIGAGEYYEIIRMEEPDTCIAFVGAGWDSTTVWTDANAYLIKYRDKTSFIDIGFKHYGTYSAKILSFASFGGPKNLYVNRCKFQGPFNVKAITTNVGAIGIVENCVFDTLQAYDGTYGPELAIFRNNICSIGYGTSLAIFWVGQKLIAENNIFWVPGHSEEMAIWQGGHIDTLIIRNNLFKSLFAATDMNLVDRGSEFSYNVCDSAYYNPGFPHLLLVNRVIPDSMHHVDVIGNSFGHDNIAVDVSHVEDFGYDPYASINYNNFWENDVDILFDIPEAFDSVGNIFSDPMFMGGNDYHLQAFSPLIDAGDPNILDVDGTRSDIGCYGGPGGCSYVYLDLAPQIPDSITVEIDDDVVILNWRSNYEADFNRYQVFRDTVSGFEPSEFNMIAEPDSSYYEDDTIGPGTAYYYRLTSVDNQGNVSDYSDEVAVIPTGIVRHEDGGFLPEYSVIESAYPNPFNSDITIVYSASNLGPQPPQVKLQIFDIQGRVVKTLVDERKPMGTYRAVWDGTDNQGWPVSSGVYMAKVFQWGQDAGDFPVKITLIK